MNPTIADVQIHPEDITLTSELLAPDTVAVTLHTGPIRLKLTDGSCLQSCVFFCCCGYDWSLDLDIDDIAVVYHVPAEAALCGTGSQGIAPFAVQSENVRIANTKVNIDGFCWLFGEIFTVGHLSDVSELVLEAITDSDIGGIKDAIGNLFTTQGGNLHLPGLADLNWSGAVGAVPISLADSLSNVPQVTEHGSMTVGLETMFSPLQALDPAPDWVPPPRKCRRPQARGAISCSTLATMP